MAGKRYYKQEFRCPSGHIHYDFIWEHELDQTKIKCPMLKENGKVCNRMMKPHFEEVGKGFYIMGKMNKSEIKKDRQKRSTEHFKKTVLPGINPKSIEGKHFHKKYKTGAVK